MGDKLINLTVGVYIPIIRIPIKGGMTIPNIATFDHGTYTPETNVASEHLMVGRWRLSFGDIAYFQGRAVSFRECISPIGMLDRLFWAREISYGKNHAIISMNPINYHSLQTDGGNGYHLGVSPTH